MTFTVDRIVGDVVILEKDDISHVEVSLDLLPDGIKEGTVLSFDGESYSINSDDEALRKRRILEKQKILFNKSKKD